MNQKKKDVEFANIYKIVQQKSTFFAQKKEKKRRTFVFVDPQFDVKQMDFSISHIKQILQFV